MGNTDYFSFHLQFYFQVFYMRFTGAAIEIYTVQLTNGKIIKHLLALYSVVNYIDLFSKSFNWIFFKSTEKHTYPFFHK